MPRQVSADHRKSAAIVTVNAKVTWKMNRPNPVNAGLSISFPLHPASATKLSTCFVVIYAQL